MAFKKMTKISLVAIIIILIVNIFIIYNQANQIKNLNNDIIWLDQRVEFLESRVYNHTQKFELLEAQVKTHEVDLNIDYDNIEWLTNELKWLNFFYYNHLECYSELMTILYNEGLIDDNFCDGVD